MSEYTLIHGDCLDILPTLAAGSVDAVICDPPYGTTACAWDSVIPFAPMWAGIKHVLKPKGAVALFGSQPFTSALVMSNPGWFRYEWIYKKRRVTGFLNANRRPMSAHENIIIFGESEPIYNPQFRVGAIHKRNREEKHNQNTNVYGAFVSTGIEMTDFYYPQSVEEFGADPETTVTRAHRPGKIERHPTQKPVALMEYLIRTYTNEGDTVLDFTMGSGTTGVAAMHTGRKFVGIEMDAGYFGIAQERIRKAAQMADGQFVDKRGAVADFASLPMFAGVG